MVKRDELRRDSDQAIDEIVVHDLDLFHLEHTSERAYWVGLTRGDRTLHLWISCTTKGRLSVTVTDDELGCHDHVTDRLH